MERMFRQRMEYLTAPAGQACFLCSAATSGSDDENFVLTREAGCFAILNRYPYNTGHLMVAPLDHIPALEDLSAELVVEMMALVTRCIKALKTEMNAQGFNFGANLGQAAGAGVPGHLHLHVVPRWGGDTNFMPVLAESKVLPESLQDTFNKLKPALKVTT